MFSHADLEGKTAIVTSASRGIGEAIAAGFAQAGADLILVSRNKSALERIANKIEGLGRKALSIAADIGKPEEIQKTIDNALKVSLGSTSSLIMQASAPF
jgi:gluconate 5-dehydrogenase